MQRIPVKPGVYPNTPWSEYRTWDAMNFSTLFHGTRSMLHLKHAIDHPELDEETSATRIGHAFHALVLQPEEYSKRYFPCEDVSFSTTEGKKHKAVAVASGKTILRYDEWQEAMNLRDVVEQSPDARAVVKGARFRELAVVWVDEETGILRKAMIDGARNDPGLSYLCDLKSTRSASPDDFAKSIVTFGYHIQLASYRKGMKAAMGLDELPLAMLIATEKEAPRQAMLYQLDDEAAEIGAREDSRLMRMLKRCRDTGIWPGYEGTWEKNDTVRQIGLPKWAVMQAQNNEQEPDDVAAE